jgi:ABC-type transporter Mla subunit MlaD
VCLDGIIVLTADALDDAATTAGTFGPTINRTAGTVGEAAAALRDVEPRLRELETQANAIEIFGQRPVARLGELFGQIATDISGLDEQLDGIATEMDRNEAALTANAESLGALADLVRAYKGRLEPAAIDAGIDDARRLLSLTLALFIGWTTVPAVGSLIVGRWMRALVQRPHERGAPPPPETP